MDLNLGVDDAVGVDTLPLRDFPAGILLLGETDRPELLTEALEIASEAEDARTAFPPFFS